MNTYGSFDEEGNFVIKNPRTPEPWLHYLIRPEQPGTSTFCSGVTNACGGFDVRGTHENTVTDTKVHLNDGDELVRCVYIKDAESGEIWSTSWQPIRAIHQHFTTTFRFGSARFDSSFDGVDVYSEFYVPLEFDGWVHSFKIVNSSGRSRKLQLYPFVPVHLGDALARLLAGDNDAFFGGSSWDSDLGGIVFRRHHGIAAGDDAQRINGMLGNVALFRCTLNQADTPYAASFEDFFGSRFNGPDRPAAVETGSLPSRPGIHLRRACGAFRNDVSLAPGETVEFACALICGKTSGYYLGGKKELLAARALVDDATERKRMLGAVREWWRKRQGSLTLKTPDEAVNRAFPWLQYQCEAVLVLNRMKSRFHTGYEYGWGFRDILQDILYLLPYRADEMRERLLFIAPQIFSTGHAYHNFFLDQKGNRAVEASDDPLWFVQAVVRYCRETADYGFLNTVCAYADEKEGLSPKQGTILEHCESCLERVLADRGDSRLPFMKDCDWNDDLNETRIDGAPSRRLESVMAAMQLHAACLDFAGILEEAQERGNSPDTAAKDRAPDLRAAKYRAAAAETADAIETRCLDREGWYKRALDVSGMKADPGSSDCAEGRIYLEPQIFAVTSGLATGEKARKLLKLAMKELDTDWGAMILWPHYNGLARRNELPDRSWNVEKEPPGIKENGAVFMHLNAWLVEAWCRAGCGDEAFALYRKTLPESLASDQDRYRCEPFVYPEYVRGRGAQDEGRGGHTWLTGTAPTMHAALTEWIFGVRPCKEGLLVDPCVPRDWKEFSMTRTFRSVRWEIGFENPNSVCKGVKTVFVDGFRIEGCVLPDLRDGQKHLARVVMG